MATAVRSVVARSWALPLVAVALVTGGIVTLFASDATDMVRLWWSVSTYQHCLFVLPIIAWLIWQRRGEVKAVEPAGWPPALILVIGAGLVWLIGEAGGVALLRHAGLVLMIQAGIIAVLGPAVARAIAFPLFYLVFLVPFGDEFVAPMQVVTARMTMALLTASGVPATLDGVFITTHAGWFEIAEACAGVKFLIALVAYGALVANICFRSAWRRALFMVAAIIIPVLANGVRAWGTIYAAELTSATFAGGFDHIIYGWVFFGLVMALLMAGAWPFFDRHIGEKWLPEGVIRVWRPIAPVMAMAPLAVMAAATPIVWDRAVSQAGRINLPNPVELPDVAGWTRVGDGARLPWMPRFDGADHVLLGHYADARGRQADVAVALYGWQDRGREIVAFGQGAADPDGPWKRAAELPPLAGGAAERLLGTGRVEREAVTFRQVGEQAVTGTARVKLATLQARLFGRDQSAGVLIVSAPGAEAPEVIAAFLHDLGDPQRRLSALLKQARGQR